MTLILSGVVLVSLLGTGLGVYAFRTGSGTSLGAGPQDWPKFLRDYANTSDAATERRLSPSTAPSVTTKWTAKTGGAIATSPTVVGGVVYVGSWDGYEYAFKLSTGALIWKTFLGQTTQKACNPPTIGVTSAAAVQNGVVYVGGGDDYWYALNASDGSVLWKVFTGDTSKGWYNWSSPVLYNGAAYIGLASNCDMPLTPGKLLKVSLSTHQVEATANFVPSGEVGGGVWTSPAIDTASNTIFVTTGTADEEDQIQSESMVSLDADTLAIKGWWQVPFSAKSSDSDWGDSPVLLTDAHGRQLVVATNKNGVLYAFDRHNLNAGPVWQRVVAVEGDCPTCGDGSVSSGAYARGLTIGNVTGVLFAAGGNTQINGHGSRGYVRAINPLNGSILWEHATSGIVIASLAYANGLLVDANGSYLELLDAKTGTSLYTQYLGGLIFGAPTVSNGNIVVGTGSNKLWDLSIGRLFTPPTDLNCPARWTCQDVGSQQTGTEHTANGVLSVSAAGEDVRAAATDEYHLITQQSSGDIQVIANIQTQSMQGPPTGYGPAAGIMVRQNNRANSPFYAVLRYPEDAPDGSTSPVIRILVRLSFSGNAFVVQQIVGPSLPKWLMIQRRGSLFTTATSRDGHTWALVPGSQETLEMPTSVMAGIAQNSQITSELGTASYSGVSVGPISTTPAPSGQGAGCPSGWACQDIGDPIPTGSQTFHNGTWTLSGTGLIAVNWNDQFHLVARKLAGDGSITAQITSQQNTSPDALAGLLMRQDSAYNSPYYGVFVTPSNGVVVQYRLHASSRTFQVTSPTNQVPLWVRVTRNTVVNSTSSEPVFSAYTSTDGINWTWVPWSTVPIDDLGGSLLAGMAADSGSAQLTSSATYTNVKVSSQTIALPTLCPSGWKCGDIGYPQPEGAQISQSGILQILGGGLGVMSTYDQFRFVWQALPGDATISAQLVNQTNTNPTAEAGLMLRASTDPAAPYYAELVQPENGVVIQYRETAAGTPKKRLVLHSTVPVYLRIARWTDTSTSPTIEYFTAYSSNDNVTWTQIPGSTVALNIPGPLLAGVAVTSHNAGVGSVATFTEVEIAKSAPKPS